MTPMDWLPWGLTVLLAAALIGYAVIRRRQAARIAAAHDARVAALTEAHKQESGQASAEHRRTLEKSMTQLAELQSSAANDQAEAKAREKQLHTYLASSLDYDLESRLALLEACRQQKLDGVMLTNLVFLRGRPTRGHYYRRQIDHIIVTTEKVILIENKGWKGIVCDGKKPSTLHRDLGSLVAAEDLGDHFAIHIGGSQGRIRIATSGNEDKGQVPVLQAKRQANDLRVFASELGLTLSWVEACVFYSHPEVKLHAADFQTTWNVRVFDRNRLSYILKSSLGPQRVDVESVMQALEPYAGDSTGFGSFAAMRPSRI
ncbi:nuclease-related domain-containing protein [Zhihengliuella salsuginis]|uniref:NERD domain-containing protein n=1 Tax=Zhihengliuella salsuginis TaxID=578222 RepID=A0ABQ3GHS0_9MICC|nr:nuclease-related domain-containing protein [Zhihengliuella salsuginis]GHD07538.1 hypothetical protein GCM10008096_18390 [Zhihengliuella salsuginis]